MGSRLPLSALFLSLLGGFYEKGRLKAKPNLLSWRAKERSQETRLTVERGGWDVETHPGWWEDPQWQRDILDSWWDKSGLFPDGKDSGRFPWFGENENHLGPCTSLSTVRHGPLGCLRNVKCPSDPSHLGRGRLPSCIQRVDVSTELVGSKFAGRQ